SRGRASGTEPNTIVRPKGSPGRLRHRRWMTSTAIRSVIRMLDSGLMAYLVPVLASLAFAGAVFAFAYPYFSADRQKDKRLESLMGARTRRINSGSADANSSRKKSVADTLKEMEDRQKANKKATMAVRLLRAGLKRSPRDFYLASAASGVLFGAVAL